MKEKSSPSPASIRKGNPVLMPLYRSRDGLKKARRWEYVEKIGGAIFMKGGKATAIHNVVQNLKKAQEEMTRLENLLAELAHNDEQQRALKAFQAYHRDLFLPFTHDTQWHNHLTDAQDFVENAVQNVSRLLAQFQEE